MFFLFNKVQFCVFIDETFELINFFTNAFPYTQFDNQGPSVETEVCYGSKNQDSWECLYGEYDKAVPDRTDVMAEIGPACRCGCM